MKTELAQLNLHRTCSRTWNAKPDTYYNKDLLIAYPKITIKFFYMTMQPWHKSHGPPL